jgi:hypothetical protein
MKHNDTIYWQLSPSMHPPFGFASVRISRTRPQEIHEGFMVYKGAKGLDFWQIIQFPFSVSTHYTYVVYLPPTLYNPKKIGGAVVFNALLSFKIFLALRKRLFSSCFIGNIIKMNAITIIIWDVLVSVLLQITEF